MTNIFLSDLSQTKHKQFLRIPDDQTHMAGAFCRIKAELENKTQKQLYSQKTNTRNCKKHEKRNYTPLGNSSFYSRFTDDVNCRLSWSSDLSRHRFSDHLHVRGYTRALLTVLVYTYFMTCAVALPEVLSGMLRTPAMLYAAGKGVLWGTSVYCAQLAAMYSINGQTLDVDACRIRWAGSKMTMARSISLGLSSQDILMKRWLRENKNASNCLLKYYTDGNPDADYLAMSSYNITGNQQYFTRDNFNDGLPGFSFVVMNALLKMDNHCLIKLRNGLGHVAARSTNCLSTLEARKLDAVGAALTKF